MAWLVYAARSYGAALTQLTNDVVSLLWRVGFDPYVRTDCEGFAFARLRLMNRDDSYTPGGVYGLTRGMRIVILRSEDSMIFFTGFIWAVDTSESLFLTVEARPITGFLNHPVNLPLMTDVTADEIITEIMCKAGLPQNDDYGTFILGTSLLGIDSYLGGVADPDACNITFDLDVGDSTFAYTGDTWGAPVSAALALEHTVLSESGCMWVGREGDVKFRRRGAWIRNTITGLSLTSGSLIDRYALDVESYASRVWVRYNPRMVLSPGTTIWESQNAIKLLAGETRSVDARYRLVDGRQCSALSGVTIGTYGANALPDDSGSDLSVFLTISLDDESAVGCRVVMANTSGVLMYVTYIRIDGTPVVVDDEIQIKSTVQSPDAAHYGKQIYQVYLPLCSNSEDAAAVADKEIYRRAYSPGSFAGAVTAFHFRGADAPTLWDEDLVGFQLNVSLLPAMGATNFQRYMICYEEHQVIIRSNVHEISIGGWFLEAL